MTTCGRPDCDVPDHQDPPRRDDLGKLPERFRCGVDGCAGHLPEETALTLTEFLTARLDETETAAKAVSPEGAYQVRTILRGPTRDFLEFWGPGLVLREVEAKRAIVAGPDAWVTERFQSWVLGHLAAVYADHPDYDEAWRP
jgi:hypothetical protein